MRMRKETTRDKIADCIGLVILAAAALGSLVVPVLACVAVIYMSQDLRAEPPPPPHCVETEDPGVLVCFRR